MNCIASLWPRLCNSSEDYATRLKTPNSSGRVCIKFCNSSGRVCMQTLRFVRTRFVRIRPDECAPFVEIRSNLSGRQLSTLSLHVQADGERRGMFSLQIPLDVSSIIQRVGRFTGLVGCIMNYPPGVCFFVFIRVDYDPGGTNKDLTGKWSI